MQNKFTKIGLISISDRASKGEYEDQGIPNLKSWLQKALSSPFETVEKIIPDERPLIESSLINFVDIELCDLILTTGGTGPALRDVTPEATLAIADREMPGFGEQMRQISLHFVPTAILSRQVAVVRKKTLIINLPGQPKSIAQTLEGLKNDQGEIMVHGIFAAVPYCIDLLNGPRIETHEDIVKTFRPKAKQ
jgi:molybdopterin adenylyltransferase